jgi:hypothetical protein
MTKGDNNDADDTSLYPIGQPYLYRHEIIGTVRGYIPHRGYAKLVFSELCWLKKVSAGITGLALGVSSWLNF